MSGGTALTFKGCSQMRMISQLLAAAALSATLAGAASAETLNFTRDGHKYVVNVISRGDVTRYVGRNVSTGERFHLVERNNHVKGLYDNGPVSFTVTEGQAVGFASR